MKSLTWILPIFMIGSHLSTGVVQAAPEPGLFGLQGKMIQASSGEPPSGPPELIEARNEGPFSDCFKVRMEQPTLDKNHVWETVFRLVSTCREQLLYRFDSAEFEGDTLVGYAARTSYPTNGGGVPEPGWWPEKTPLPPDLGFEPNNREGEGLLYTGPPSWLGGGPEPGTFRVSAKAPKHTFKYYIVTCARLDERTGRENVMWVSGKRLMDEDTTFKCLPAAQGGQYSDNMNGPIALTRSGNTGRDLVEKGSTDAAAWDAGRTTRGDPDQGWKAAVGALQPAPVQEQRSKPSSGFNFGQVFGAAMQGYAAARANGNQPPEGKCIANAVLCREIETGIPEGYRQRAPDTGQCTLAEQIRTSMADCSALPAAPR